MKNNLLSFKLLYVKYFLKTGGTFMSPLKYLKNSPSGIKASERNLRFTCLRPLCTSVNTSENLIQKCNENKNTIIYMGALTAQVKGVKVFSCMTSVAGLVVQPMLVHNVTQEISLPLGIALCSCVGFFTFVTPFLIHLITKKYVTEIWYNSATETYTAILLTFFLRRVEISFKVDDVSIPDVLPVFSTMYIKEKPVLVAADSFLNKEHYIKMMQYDKPIDLESIFGGKSKKNEKSEIV